MIDKKIKEHINDKELVTILENSKYLYNLTSLKDTKVKKVTSIKKMKCCSKMIFLYVVAQGGSLSFENRTELVSIFGMSYIVIQNGINELVENNLIRFNKISKIITII